MIMEIEIEMGKEKMKKPMPRLNLDGEDMIDGVELGDDVTLKVKARLVSASVKDEMSPAHQCFIITGIDKSKDDSMLKMLSKKRGME